MKFDKKGKRKGCKKIVVIGLLFAMLLTGCGGGGGDEEGNTGDVAEECVVDVSGNIVISNITGDVFLDFGACSQAAAGDCTGSCDTDLEACIEHGESTGLVSSDEECQDRYDDCVKEC